MWHCFCMMNKIRKTERAIPAQGGFKMSLITITTGIGCEGMAIGQLVADGLKIDLYDDQRLQEDATKIGIPPEAPENLDEKTPGLFYRLWSNKPEI